MDQAQGVRRRQPASRLHIRVDDLLPRARRVRDPLAQGAAVDELHHDVDLPLVGARLVDGHDVGMADAPGRLRLTEQPDA